MKKLCDCLPDSVTTGKQLQAQTQPNLIGMQPGATGYATAVQPSDRLAAMTFQQAENELDRLLPQCVSSRLKLKQKTIYSPDGQADFIPIGCDLVDLENIPTDELYRAASILAKACAPCPESVLKMELGALMAMTVARRDDAETIIRVYARALQAYPADCVVSAIRGMMARTKYFPALSELVEDIEWRAKPRQFKRQAVLMCLKLPS